MRAASSVDQASRILVRGVNWLGDAVMTTPALQRLRERFPDAKITLLTEGKLAELWKHHPAVDETISFSREEGVLPLLRRLREQRFDLALIFPNSFRSAFECWRAGVPVRVGYGGNARSLLLTQNVAHPAKEFKMRKRSVAEVRNLIASNSERSRTAVPATAHHIHHYLLLVKAVGARDEPMRPQIHVRPEETSAFAAKFGLSGQVKLFGLNAGAEYGPAKRWPAENFIAAAIEISRAVKSSWLVFGGAGDVELNSRIASEINSTFRKGISNGLLAINTAGRTTLRELCAGLALCSTVLTNDSGPMHVAAAVGARVVVPFGSTSPELTGPGLPGDERHTILRSPPPCAPCFLRSCPIDLRCLTQIKVDDAVAAVLKADSSR
jgi:heptosyltransferase-2